MAYVRCKCGFVKKQIPDDNIGKKAKCPKCAKVIVVEKETKNQLKSVTSNTDIKESNFHTTKKYVFRNKNANEIHENLMKININEDNIFSDKSIGEMCNTILTNEPAIEDPTFFCIYGIYLKKNGYMSEGVEAFLKTIELEKKYPFTDNMLIYGFWAYYNVGRYYYYNDKVEEAIPYLEKSLYLGAPSDEIHNSTENLIAEYRYDAWTKACATGEYEIVKDLIEKGMDINNDIFGESPLFIACRGKTDENLERPDEDFTKVVKLLIDKGANVNFKRHDNSTPLHTAAFYKKLEYVYLLIDHGSDATALSVTGGSTILAAVSPSENTHDNDENIYNIVKVLIDNGADPDISHKGFTVLQIAKHRNLNKTSELIKEKSKHEDSDGCYIATVCYESKNSNEVMILKQYRDQILKQYTYGRLIINIYNKYSPQIAHRLKYYTVLNRHIRKLLDIFIRLIRYRQPY